MISFYPGPSKVWDALPRYMQEAWATGMLSVNHRSPQFAGLWQDLVKELHQKLAIPENYSILPASSATECWEIVAQSLLGLGGNSLHLYNGAFGEKWRQYTNKITRAANKFPFEPDSLPNLSDIQSDNYQLVALTHNETSNGTALPDDFMHELRQLYPQPLIAADATSSMAGADLPWATADLWFASVQKCFGLPAGLALLICSPKALDMIARIGENKHYNSLLSMVENAQKGQTTHTPNVLNLFLMLRSLQERPAQAVVARLLQERWQAWREFWKNQQLFELLVENSSLQSKTVLCLKGQPDTIGRLKADALAAGFYLGNGYGPWKETTFRIANFPALTDAEISALRDFLQQWLSRQAL